MRVRASDPELLSALLSHDRYQDSYMVADAHWTPTPDWHGPYRLDCLGVDSFESVDASAVMATVRAWAESYEGRDGTGFTSIIQTANGVIEAARSLWHLVDLRDSAEPELGQILDEYVEIVAIDRTQRSLTLLVASAD